MSTKVRPASGQLLVIGIFLGILALAGGTWWMTRGSERDGDAQFAALMNSGKTYADNGDFARSLDAFIKSLAMNPQNPDVHLNLANVLLLANRPGEAEAHAAEAAHLEAGNAAGHFLLGCSLLRQNQPTNAIQALQIAKDIDRSINPVSYQLGRAYAALGRFEDAAAQFTEVTQFETNHPSAFYQLSQALLRLGKRDEATVALAAHQAISAGKTQSADNPSLYEKCVYTEFRAPIALEQPSPDGIRVRFTDATTQMIGEGSEHFHGPFGVLDLGRRAIYDLLVLDGEAGPRLLQNREGKFLPKAEPLAAGAAKRFTSAIVGDLNNDRADDVVLAGPDGMMVLRCSTNGTLTDVSRMSSSAGQQLSTIVLADLEFTGRLGVMGISAAGGQPRFLRGAGNFLLRETNQTLFAGISGATQVVVDDWDNDDLPDVLLTRAGLPPAVLVNVRGGKLAAPVTLPEWPIAKALAVGDFNNDFRADVVFVTDQAIEVFFGGLKQPRRLPQRENGIRSLRAIDYDNDGWLDLVAWGADGVHVWRNRGRLGFHETTTQLGLAGLKDVRFLVAADLDRDGDTDFVLDVGGKMRLFRNEGGNANVQLKLALFGNRSNASGLGVKVEAAAGAWRILRSVAQLPAEIGVGRHDHLDALNIRWFDTMLPGTDVVLEGHEPVPAIEIFVNSTGSCPYLYVWDGTRFRFVTDLLGAAPLGLPVAAGKYIAADPEEIVWIGDSTRVQPKAGRVVCQITEELREILYLDVAELLVVDRPLGMEVHSSSQLRASGPFAKPGLIGLRRLRPPLRATTLDGVDVTAALAAVDGLRWSPQPTQLRGSQFRGLAEEHGVVLDFGPLDPGQPLALVLTGWLRFGGGMANVGGSQRDDFPFPFPVLEGELDDGTWVRLAIPPAAPAGKTKTIVLDLSGRLPPGVRRLRLTEAFEIHWDRIALGERVPSPAATVLLPVGSDLHFRGFSQWAEMPPTEPPTPDYARLLPGPNWTRTPSGWATRYGPVGELLRAEDQGLCLVAGGDELTLEFDVSTLPPPDGGSLREYFLRSVGWDKDADYHVAEGTTIEPLPWRGMEDQRYGKQPRPPMGSDALHARFNTRWVGPNTVIRVATLGGEASLRSRNRPR